MIEPNTPPSVEERVNFNTGEVLMDPPVGDPVMRLQEVTVAFAGRRAVRGVSFDAHDGEITSLIGPSGSGKTTLVDTLLGRIPLSAGTRRLGPSVVVGELAQDRRILGDVPNLADAFIAALNDRAIAPVIPSKSNRKTPRPCDFALYCERNLIERFFNKLKHFRAIATRYDKLAKIFLAGVHLACAAILLN